MYQNPRLYPRLYRLSTFLLLLALMLFSSAVVVQASTLNQNNNTTAVVVVPALNVRSGPGTNYAKVGLAKSGDTLTVLGQAGNCAWLQIRTAQSLDGWVSGSARYVTLSQSCAGIPMANMGATSSAKNPVQSAETPSVATPAPTATPVLASSTERPSWLAPGAEIGMVAELEQKVPLKPDQACILFQNFVGRPIYITLTQQDGPHIEEIPMEKNIEKVLCLPGGKYSVVITSANVGEAGGQIKFYNGTRDEFRVFRR